MVQGTSQHSKRGFASMDEARQKEIASKGGQAAHEKGTAHEFSSEEAREAGRKGGKAVSKDREHMAEIGRKGGEARGASVSSSAGERGGTSVHHAKAGAQSHKSQR
jgi:general stress protein YciG